MTTMRESFAIQFSGRAFDDNEISASALAQSLLSLDELTMRASEAVYGKDSHAEVKVKAGFRQGSFIVDLIASCKDDPVTAVTVAAGVATVVGFLKEIVSLGKFSRGKKAEIDSNKVRGSVVEITNDHGEVSNFNVNVVNIYNQGRTQLSRLTQTLDKEGAEFIRIYTDDSDQSPQVITKQDREFFRQEEGIVLTDNEAEVILDIISPMMNGSGKGWRFSEGEDGIEFTANVEDDEFLEKVKSRDIKFENGTAVRAIVRTVQRRSIRTVTDRTIVEVKEVLAPGNELF